MGRKHVFGRRLTAALLCLAFGLSLGLAYLLPVLAAPGLEISLSPNQGSEAGGYYIHIVNDGEVDFDASVVHLVVNGHDTGYAESDVPSRIVVTPREILFFVPPYDLGAALEQEAFIYVRNGDGTASTLKSFMYVNDPDIERINQNTQTTLIRNAVGAIVDTVFEKQSVIVGDNFSLTDGDSRQITQVTIGGYNAEIRERRDRTVVVKNPDPINEGTTYNVVVRNLVGGTDIMANLVRPTPIIHNLSKFKVTQGNTLDITGEGFTADSVVKIDNTLITPTTITANLLTITVPVELVPGSGKDVTVIDNSTGQMATLVDELEVFPSFGDVQILSIYPNAGSVNGGTTVRIAGKGFQASMEVRIDGQVVTSKTILDPSPSDPPEVTSVFSVVTPPAQPGKVGQVSVQIWDPNTGTVVTENPVGFTYLLADNTLSITDFIDADGNRRGYDTGGESIYIHGKKILWWISPDSTANRTITYPTREQVTTKMVVTTEQATIPDPYITENPPDITVTVTRQITLDFGGRDAYVSSITGPDDGTQLLTAEAPRVNLDPPEDTEYSLNITTRTIIKRQLSGEVLQDVVEQTTAADTYMYQPFPSEPEIDSVTPNEGPTAGGTAVTIAGADFRTDVEVYFGDIKPQNKGTVTGQTIGPGQRGNKLLGTIAVTSPRAYTRGAVDVHVVNPDGGSATLAGGFTYHSSPTVTGILPTKGNAEGGTYITITGTEFQAGAGGTVGTSVYLVDTLTSYVIATDNVYVVSSTGEDITGQANQLGTKIKARIPPLTDPDQYPIGRYRIRVENNDGGVALSPAGLEFEIVAPPDNQPLIGTITPDEGNIRGGTDIVITGSNFVQNMLVTIDGEPLANQVVQNNATITGRTPAGSRAGLVPVQVINLDTGGTATKEDGFRYHRIETNPRITSITPNHGTAGTRVIITGTDFVKGGLVDGQLLPCSEVYFGDTVVRTVYNNPTDQLYVVGLNQIMVTVPDLQVPGQYEVKVRNPDTAEAVASVRFNYQIPTRHPTITSLTPEQGTVAGGTDVTITGKDFEGGLELYFGTSLATDIQVENLGLDPDDGRWNMRIRAKTPPGQAGEVNVTVVNPTGGSDTIPNSLVPYGFTYVIPQSSPQIIDIAPRQGSTAGYETVTIRGRDFRQVGGANPVVTIGGLPATVLSFVDDPIQGQAITIMTPPSTTAGPKDVTVTNPDPDNGTVTRPGGYTYTQGRITVTSIIPPKVSINGDTVVTITGTGFMRPTQVTEDIVIPATEVWIDGSELTGTVAIDGNTYNRVEVLSATTMRVVTQAVYEAGFKEIRLVNPDNTEFIGQIEYVDPATYPVITGIDPQAGTVDGGTLVTITGQNFRTDVQLYIGTVLAEIVSRSQAGTELLIKTPPGKLTDVGRKLDVTVYNQEDGGSDTWIEAWEYKAHGVNPSITGVQPNTGSTLGGDLITITGNNFRDGARVFFGTTEATSQVTVLDYQTITLRTPAKPAGVYDVTVRNPDYGEATLANGFTYQTTIPEPPASFDADLSWDERGVRLTWGAVAGADLYELYGFYDDDYDSNPDDDEYEFITTTAETYYYLTDLEDDTYYYFRMRTLNRHGASPFVEATLYVDEPEEIHRETEVDRDDDRVEQRGDSLNITVGTDELDNGRRYTHIIDLDEDEYAAVKTLQIYVPGEVVRGSGYISVLTPRYEVTFSPYVFYGYEFRQAKDDDREVYGRLTVSEANPREIERAALKLPSGDRVVGTVELTLELVDGRLVTPLTGSSGSISVTMPYNSKTVGMPKGVYYYDPATGSWEAGRGRINTYNKTASLETDLPGRYAVIFSTR